MDFTGYSMDQDPALVVEYTTESRPLDYVKWQGSQTACHALNQLIKSSTNDPNLSKENARTSRVWQRETSFDQIPGFSLLSTTDATSSSSTRTPPSASSSKPFSSSRPPKSRPRTSEVKAQPKSTILELPSVDLPIPLLDKTNPTQFLDMLKGVSARVDANAGVRPRGSVIDPLLPSRIAKVRKRARNVSLGNASEVLALKAKKSRVEIMKAQAKDKDKGRAAQDMGEKAGQNLHGHNTPPIIPSSSRISSNLVASWPQQGDGSFMDVDHGDKSMIDVSANPSVVVPPRPPLTKTASQAKMPPPPAPIIRDPATSISMSSRSGAPSTSTTYVQNSRHEPSHKDPRARTSDQTPKYHPLLLQQSAKQPISTPSSINPSVPNPQQCAQLNKPRPSPVQASVDRTPKVEPRYPAPKPQQHESALPTSTPHTSSQSSRPPALGMRRTHTYPSTGMIPSIQKTGVLPTKQKGFKPPLLSSSQPQPRSQGAGASANHAPPPHPVTKDPPQRAQEHSYPTKGSTSAVGRGQQRQYNAVPRIPAGSNGSTSPESIYPPPSSFSTPTFNTTSPASSIPSIPHNASRRVPSATSGRTPGSLTRKEAIAKALEDAKAEARAPQPRAPPPRAGPSPAAPPPPPPPAPASPVLPEPTDDDGDSSFGDMSFDMDALEETMRQYD